MISGDETARGLRRELMLLRSLIIEMRIAQVEYFATKDRAALIRSKAAEAKIDKEIFGKALRPGGITEAEDLLCKLDTEKDDGQENSKTG
jgi:hypothetical protein